MGRDLENGRWSPSVNDLFFQLFSAMAEVVLQDQQVEAASDILPPARTRLLRSDRQAPKRLIVEPVLEDGSENPKYNEWTPVFTEAGVQGLQDVICDGDNWDLSSSEHDPDFVPPSETSDDDDDAVASQTHEELKQELEDLMNDEADDDKELQLDDDIVIDVDKEEANDSDEEGDDEGDDEIEYIE